MKPILDHGFHKLLYKAIFRNYWKGGKNNYYNNYVTLTNVLPGAHNMKERRTLYNMRAYPLVHLPLE